MSDFDKFLSTIALGLVQSLEPIADNTDDVRVKEAMSKLYQFIETFGTEGEEALLVARAILKSLEEPLPPTGDLISFD